MSGRSAERAHALPMAWSLRPTARLNWVVSECRIGDCEACARVKAEIQRRERCGAA